MHRLFSLELIQTKRKKDKGNINRYAWYKGKYFLGRDLLPNKTYQVTNSLLFSDGKFRETITKLVFYKQHDWQFNRVLWLLLAPLTVSKNSNFPSEIIKKIISYSIEIKLETVWKDLRISKFILLGFIFIMEFFYLFSLNNNIMNLY